MERLWGSIRIKQEKDLVDNDKQCTEPSNEPEVLDLVKVEPGIKKEDFGPTSNYGQSDTSPVPTQIKQEQPHDAPSENQDLSQSDPGQTQYCHDGELRPKIYKCLQCTFQTKFEYYFRNHLWYEHLTCCYCLYRCTKIDNLSDHIREKHGSSLHLLTVHEAQIQEEPPAEEKKPVGRQPNSSKSPLPLQCMECPLKARTVRAIKNHVCGKHPAPEMENFFKCRRLGASGYEGPYYNCSMINCSFHTRDLNAMENHLLRNHVQDPEEIPKYICERCSFQTGVRRDFRRHVLRHSPPKEISNFHKCDFCEYRISQKSLLKRHVKNKHSGSNRSDDVE